MPRRRSYRGRYKRRPWAGRLKWKRKLKRRKMSLPANQANRFLRRSYRKLKRRPFNQIITSHGGNPNSQIVRFTRMNQYRYTQTGLVSTSGIIEEDLTIDNCMDPEDRIKLAQQYASFQILGLVITFYISDTNSMTQVTNAGTSMTNYFFTQTTDTRANPLVWIKFCYSALVQDELAAINATTLGGTRRWASVPYVARLNQYNKVIRRWTIPKSLSSLVHHADSLAAGNKLSTILGDGLRDNNPHGFVALFADYAKYASQMNFTLNYRIDSVFIFKQRRPATS